VGERRAELFLDCEAKLPPEHRHIFFFERSETGWRWTGYATSDEGLLGRLCRGFLRMLV